MQLLFVAVARDGDQIAKERQYAACKAHTTRNAHQRRRQARWKAAGSSVRHSLEAPCHKIGSLHPDIGSLRDQFDGRPMERTPLFEEAISFVRFYHNASWSPVHVNWLEGDTSRSARRLRSSRSTQTTAPDWLWSIFVANMGTFESVVASIVPILRPITLSKDTRELENLSLQLKARSFLRLRHSLQSYRTNFLPSLGLIYHVKALFREASMSGDLQSANIHAKMLVWLVEKLPRQTVPETNLLRIALWSDAVPALLQMRRPVMAYQHWMPELVSSIWTSVESTLRCVKPSDQGSLGCICSRPLRAAFIHARRALEIQQACADHRLEYTEQIFQWMVTKAEYHISTMLDLYLDLNESIGNIGLSKGERHTEAAMALALLHIYQKSFSNISRADRVDMHESAGVIHPALIIHIRDAAASCTPSETRTYRGVHSWLLLVGAWCEKRLGCSSSMVFGASPKELDGSPLAMSQEQLAKRGRDMKSRYWVEARYILSQFCQERYLGFVSER